MDCMKIDSIVPCLSVQSDEEKKNIGKLIEVVQKGKWPDLEKLLKKFDREGFHYDSLGDHGKHLLHLVAELGLSVLMNRLIEYCKIDVNVADNQGRSSLYYAIMARKLPTVKWLVAKNADRYLVARGTEYQPIHFAAETGDTRIISFLLDEQKSDDKKESDQISKHGTPLEVAVQYGHVKAVEIFLQNNYKGIFQDSIKNENALMRAIHIGSLEILKLLVKDDTTFLDDTCYQYARCNGETPLGLAVSLGYHNIVKWLIDHKADPDSPSQGGRLPIEVAVFKGDTEMICLLLPITKAVKPYAEWSIEGLYSSIKVEGSDSSIEFLKVDFLALWSQRKIDASRHHIKLAWEKVRTLTIDEITWYHLHEASTLDPSNVLIAGLLIFYRLAHEKRLLNKEAEEEEADLAMALQYAGQWYRQEGLDVFAVKAFNIALAVKAERAAGHAPKILLTEIEPAIAEESRQAIQDPTTEWLSWIAKERFEEAFNGVLERRDLAVVYWLCSKVDLKGILSIVPLPLSQGVLLSLFQQLACGLSQETPQKVSVSVSWMSYIAAALDPSDPTIIASVGDILKEVYGVLDHHHRGLSSLMHEIKRIEGSL